LTLQRSGGRDPSGNTLLGRHDVAHLSCRVVPGGIVAAMDRPRPCAFCNSVEFAERTNVTAEIWINNACQDATHFKGKIRVCIGCGHTDWFMQDPSGWSQRTHATGVKAKSAPYR
jgi:hypothetical protein